MGCQGWAPVAVAQHEVGPAILLEPLERTHRGVLPLQRPGKLFAELVVRIAVFAPQRSYFRAQLRVGELQTLDALAQVLHLLQHRLGRLLVVPCPMAR